MKLDKKTKDFMANVIITKLRNRPEFFDIINPNRTLNDFVWSKDHKIVIDPKTGEIRSPTGFRPSKKQRKIIKQLTKSIVERDINHFINIFK